MLLSNNKVANNKADVPVFKMLKPPTLADMQRVMRDLKKRVSPTPVARIDCGPGVVDALKDECAKQAVVIGPKPDDRAPIVFFMDGIQLRDAAYLPAGYWLAFDKNNEPMMLGTIHKK